MSIQGSVTTQLLLPLEPLKRPYFACVFFFLIQNLKKNRGKKKTLRVVPLPTESKQDKGPKSASTQSTKASNGFHWSFCLFFSVAKTEHGIDYYVLGLSLFVSRICFMVKLKILHTICSMKSVSEFYVILLLVVDFVFFFFSLYTIPR